MTQSKQIYKIRIQAIITILLISFIFLSANEDIYAKKKKKRRNKNKITRVYNKTKTKAEALEILKSSEEVAEIAGLEPTVINRGSSAYIDLNIDEKDQLNKNLASNQNQKSANNSIDKKTANPQTDIELLKSYLESDTEIGEAGEDLAELESEDDVEVDIDDFHSIWLLAIGGEGSTSDSTSFGVNKEQFMSLIMNWFGIPYRFGGREETGIDCSAWVQQIFYESCKILLPRTAREQVSIGRKVKREKLEFGDLVFFHTYSMQFASHVGIYLGDNLFAHASSRKGVTVSSLESTFYNNRFICGRRLSLLDVSNYKIASTSKSQKAL